MPIGTIEVPVTHVTEEPTICIPINVEWIPAILAMVSPARYPEFWAGTLAENRRARLEVQNLIYLISNGGFCDMTTCCIPPYIIHRTNPDTGMVEISLDNGATWQPPPNSLPTVINEPIPPVTSGIAGTKCDAATNIQTQMEAWVSHVTSDFDTAVDLFAFGTAVILAITDAVLIIASAGILSLIETEILTAIGSAIALAFSAGKTVFSDYWTDAVKKKLLCITLDHIGDDGSFTDATFSDAWNDFNTNMPGGVAKILFMGFLSSIGRQGMNNMASSGTSSGADCSICTDCTVTPVIPAGGGTQDSVVGCVITASSFTEGDHQALYLWINNTTGTYDPTLGGIITDVAVLSGSIDLQGYNEKPSGTLHFPSLTIDHVELSQAYWTSGAPFQLQITVDA